MLGRYSVTLSIRSGRLANRESCIPLASSAFLKEIHLILTYGMFPLLLIIHNLGSCELRVASMNSLWIVSTIQFILSLSCCFYGMRILRPNCIVLGWQMHCGIALLVSSITIALSQSFGVPNYVMHTCGMRIPRSARIGHKCALY